LPGEELLMDYDGDGELDNFDWIDKEKAL